MARAVQLLYEETRVKGNAISCHLMGIRASDGLVLIDSATGEILWEHGDQSERKRGEWYRVRFADSYWIGGNRVRVDPGDLVQIVRRGR